MKKEESDLKEASRPYEIIIIGAGAAGLFAAASVPRHVNGILLDRNQTPGRKLLLSGAGQCNLTHSGDIKEFIPHYGINGGRIRTVLYRFHNRMVCDFFEDRNVPLLIREDGKVFPRSLKAVDVVDALVSSSKDKGFVFQFSTAVQDIRYDEESNLYAVSDGSTEYHARILLIATGGCSYPVTGSDGSLFPLLAKLGLQINPLKPALTPVTVQEYPFSSLSGISFEQAKLTIKKLNSRDRSESTMTVVPSSGSSVGQLLFTHTCFSGPLVLNHARYLVPGDEIILSYLPHMDPVDLQRRLIKDSNGNSRQTITLLTDLTKLPKRFLEAQCHRAGVDSSRKASQLSGSNIRALSDLLCADKFSVSGLGGYHLAMTTCGGLSLDEVNLKTMESKKFPGLFFAGEVLDIDGDTGGYNLQFAFSSGHIAAMQLPLTPSD